MSRAPAAKPKGMPRAGLRDFSQSLPMALLRTRESVMRHFRPMLRHFDLTEQQWRVLRALCEVTRIEVTQLARATCILGPSLSRILRDLDARGLIARQPSETDLRFGLVSISPAGAALVAGIGVQSEAIYADMAGRCDPGRLAQLMDLLRAIDSELGDGALAAWDETAPGAMGPGNTRRRGRPRKAG
jgi:homoprotocatechuate degradation regulator HpaR